MTRRLDAEMRRRLLLAARRLAAHCFMSGCAGVQSALDPAGPQAGRIGGLWWLMLYIADGGLSRGDGRPRRRSVLARGALTGTRRRARLRLKPEPAQGAAHVGAVIGGVAATIVILFVLLVGEFPDRPRAPSPAASGESALTIQVTGHQWWWEVAV